METRLQFDFSAFDDRDMFSVRLKLKTQFSLQHMYCLKVVLHAFVEIETTGATLHDT